MFAFDLAWNSDTLTYTDGANSVTVFGVDNVSLKFGVAGGERYGSLAAADAFSEFSSEKIFEERDKGMLA